MKSPQAPQFNFVVKITPVVKYLLIINIAIWIFAILIGQGYVLKNEFFFDWFGLIPNQTIFNFKFWQMFTYMFIHSPHLNHILFNMLLLWWVGGQLETTMGSKNFLKYYLVCGVGAGILYLVILYGVFFTIGLGTSNVLNSPVIGASGSIFGLLMAFAIFHGENVVYFMMLFPMRAKWFVALLVLIEVFVLMSSGVSGPVANLAHLGGIIVGFIYLMYETRRRQQQGKKVKKRSHKSDDRRNLRLVVDNEKKKPTYH